MPEEFPNVSQQIEALLHDWRNFPYLCAAVSSTRQILEHPENYVCQNRQFPNDVISLTEEIQNGRKPLSGITYLYDTSPLQQIPVSSRQKVFLQIYFKLCNTISPPKPEYFEPHISIIHASVDGDGKILPMTVEQWGLKVKKNMMGRAKIVLAHPESLTRDTLSKLQGEISKLTNPISAAEPYETTYYAWTGIRLNVLPKPHK